MSSSRLYLVFISVIIVQTCTINGDTSVKSSLTFVIDDSAQMWIAINEVRDAAIKIVDIVLDSKIKNFILVTFNNHNITLQTITKSRDKFKRALNNIHINNGDDCPEFTMTAIDIALKQSLPSSYVYVFTDASAEDSICRFEHVKNLALEKQSQIIFILMDTNECSSRKDGNYKDIYHLIAEATSGRVFDVVMNDDFKSVFEYVIETLTDKVHINLDVEKEYLLENYNEVTYNVEFCARPIYVAATGEKPIFGEIIGPGGSKLKTEHIIIRPRFTIVKFTCETPGEYDVETWNAQEMHWLVPSMEHPEAETHSSVESVEEGQLVGLKCDIPLKNTDLVCWYKNGRVRAVGDLILRNATLSDDGLYTCHVCDPKTRTVTTKVKKIKPQFNYDIEKKSIELILSALVAADTTEQENGVKNLEEGLLSKTIPCGSEFTCHMGEYFTIKSVTIKVEVGYKPRFNDSFETEYEFMLGYIYPLDCNSVGIPMPKVIWKHNGVVINDETDMTYTLQTIKLTELGIYTCEVSNKFGSIQRSYNISFMSKDCLFDITKHFTARMPIITTKTYDAYNFTDQYMVIPHKEYFRLKCQTRFLHLPANIATAVCEGGTKVKILGKIYEFTNLKCNKEQRPQTEITRTNCLPGNRTYIQVGFNLRKKFLKAYEVCFDMDKKVTLFTKHKMSPRYNVALTDSTWFSSDLLPINFDKMYDCKKQLKLFSTLERNQFCCFSKRQLVNAHDLHPSLPPTASFYSLNVIPHWNTCNMKNWEEMEVRVRNLVRKANHDMIIYTGQEFDDTFSPNINLHNGLVGYQTVPQYLWKVVQDPLSAASLAIIQVNVPDLSPADTSDYVLCRDICHLTEWMQSNNWDNVEDGFLYCCNVTQFEEIFNKTFSPKMKHILMDVQV